MSDPLALRLREVLEAAHRRYRHGQSGFGALVTPPIPAALIDQVADGLAPVMRELVEETVAARLDAPGVHDLDTVLAEARLAPTDLRPNKQAG
jgi:hypothetical protein